MHKPDSPSKHRQLIALAVVIALSSTVLGCRDNTAPAAAPVAAPSTAAAQTRQQAITALMALPELKAWAALIEKNSGGSAHGAVIEYDPALRVVDGAPYFQLSFVENTKDAVHRWEDFLVAQKDGAILVEDGSTDKLMTVAQWRDSKRPLERTH